MHKTYVDEVAKNLYVLRIDDNEVKYFEALWYIPEGVTYNSYVLLTEEGAVVFDSWKHIYADLYIETLKRIIDLRDIKYVIIHHTEPDHSGSIPKLLEATSHRPIVIGHPIAKSIFTAFYGVEPKFKTISDLETLQIGSEKIRFIHIPWLHWPDTVATYLENKEILLTCDVFGGYSTPPSLYDDDDEIVNYYLPYARKYLVSIIGFYRDHIIKNINKLRSLGIKPRIIAPAHGIIWRRRPEIIIDYYYRIASAEPDLRKIIIVYSTMYGFMQKVINVIAEDLRSRGYETKIYSFNDREYPSTADILSDAIDSSIIILGLSTYDGKIFPPMEYVIKLLIDKINSEKPVIIVNTYGWGRLHENTLRALLSNSKFKLVDVISIRGAYTKADIDRLRQSIEKVIIDLMKK
ncbi:MAG: FprA family A-type flavoprotein [Sulfolobales archaeon]